MDAAPGTEAAVETGVGHTEVAVGQTDAGVEGRASAVAVGGRIAVARGVGAADAGVAAGCGAGWGQSSSAAFY